MLPSLEKVRPAPWKSVSGEVAFGSHWLWRTRTFACQLLVLVCLAGLDPAWAQTPEEALLANEVRNARAHLQWERRGLPGGELDRLAEFVGRSNYLANAIATAFRNNNLTNAEALLGRFPGKLDDVRDFGQPLLFRAAQGGNDAQLAFLLEHQVDPNGGGALPATFGEVPLSIAISSRHWAGALRLVRAGASVTTTNAQGQPALGQMLNGWWSNDDTAADRTALVEELLARGADPFTACSHSDRRAVVEQALSMQPEDLGERLLTNHPSISQRTPQGDTALHVAARWGLTNAIEFLLRSGFPVDLTNADGLTPLQCIADSTEPAGGQQRGVQMMQGFRRFGRLATTPPSTRAVADFLLHRDARLDVFCAAGLGLTHELAALLQADPALANARDGLGRTPLHYAATHAAPPSFMALVGPTVTAGPPATRTNHVNAAVLLLHAGADPAVTTTKPIPALHHDTWLSPAGAAPLHLAVLCGSDDLIRLLLAAGAPVATANQAGDTPLHLAARVWLTNGAVRLLAAHAPVNVTNAAGETPLRAAVGARVSLNTQLLLAAGARPELGLGGDTLMHLAAANGDTATLAVLLAHGLALEGRDPHGATPFARAAAAHACDALEWLRHQGADVNATDADQNTALHLLSAHQNETAFHMVQPPWWDRWKQKSYSHPGLLSKTLTLLVTAKIVAPPIPPRWTNLSVSGWLIDHGARVTATNKLGQTPLHILCGQPWAAYDGASASNRLDRLLRADARLDRTDAAGRTPLRLALTNLAPELVAWLLPRAGNLDAFRDARGQTLLHGVMGGLDFNNRQRSLDTLRILLGAHLNPNLRDADGATPLHLAMRICATNLNFPLRETVSLFLTTGANPTLADHEGRTPLHWLAASTDANTHPGERLGDVLLSGHWNFAARDHTGQTPIHLWAANLNTGCGNCLQFLRSVLTNAGLVNLTNGAGDTPLHLAARAHRDSTFPALLDAGANPSARNREGETGFRLVAMNNWVYPDTNRSNPVTNRRFYEALYSRDEAGFGHWLEADPTLCNLTNTDGLTPLLAASERDLSQTVERLLALGAVVDLRSAMRLERWADFEQQMAQAKGPIPADWLFEAVGRRRPRAVREFLATGSDIQARDGEGHSLLYGAVTSGQTELADWLRARGCAETLFDAIARKDRGAVAAALDRQPSALMATNRNGSSPLLAAAIAANEDLAGLLLERGAKTTDRTSGGWSLLHICAARNLLDLGRRMLEAGVDPNELALGGLGPLHLAAAYGHTEFVDLLVTHGANPSLSPPEDPRWSGNTPLHWAATKGHAATVKTLLAHGADPTVHNRSGQDPANHLRGLPLHTSWGFLTPPGLPAAFSAVASETQRQEILALLEAPGAATRQGARRSEPDSPGVEPSVTKKR